MLCLLCQNTEEDEAYDTAENGGQLYEAEPQSHYTPHDDLYQTPKESAAEGEALYFFILIVIIVLLAAVLLWRSHMNAYTALQDSINAVQLSTLDTGAKKGLKPVTLMILLLTFHLTNCCLLYNCFFVLFYCPKVENDTLF